MTKIFLKVCFLLTLLSFACGNAFADESMIKTELDENDVLKVTANTKELSGTKVSWMIIKSGKNVADVENDTVAADGHRAEDVIQYMNTTEVLTDKSVAFTYQFTENSESGKYVVRMKIYGENDVRESAVYYSNKKAVQKAVDELNNGTDLTTVLDFYIKDIDYEIGEKYFDYSEKQKQYIVDVVNKDGKPDTADKLKERVALAAQNLQILEELKNKSKTEYRDYFEKNIERFDIDKTDNYSIFKSMPESKKEKVYVTVMQKDNEVKTPDELCYVFGEAVDTVNKEKDTHHSTGGGSGSSGGFALNPNSSQMNDDEKDTYFDDLEGALWAEKAITALAEKKIINGIGDNKFAPNKPITREAFVQVIVKAFELETDNETEEFEDVAEDAWYHDSVMIAASCGIINGKSKTIFGAGENITRQDIAVIVLRACRYKGVGVYTVDMNAGFNDMDEVSDYAKEAVEKMAKAKMINGKENGNFDPKGEATRAHVAQIIYNVLFT